MSSDRTGHDIVESPSHLPLFYMISVSRREKSTVMYQPYIYYIPTPNIKGSLELASSKHAIQQKPMASAAESDQITTEHPKKPNETPKIVRIPKLTTVTLITLTPIPNPSKSKSQY